MAQQPLELVVAANGLLLLLAGAVALAIARVSLLYRRNIGDDRAQRRKINTVIYLLMLLFFIGLISAALNLFVV